MRRIIVPVLAFLLGTTVALVIYKSVVTERPSASHETTVTSAAPPPPLPSAPSVPPDPHARASKLLQSGHLREAQDAFLEILVLNPKDQEALRGLVVVRRYMAGDNPIVLRRQAAEYWDAIKRGVFTEEHYSPRTMEILVTASVQAVQEIEAQAGPAAQPVPDPGEATAPPVVPSRVENTPPGTKPQHSPVTPRPATPAPPAKPAPAQSPFAAPGKFVPPAAPAKATAPPRPAVAARLAPPVTKPTPQSAPPSGVKQPPATPTAKPAVALAPLPAPAPRSKASDKSFGEGPTSAPVSHQAPAPPASSVQSPPPPSTQASQALPPAAASSPRVGTPPASPSQPVPPAAAPTSPPPPVDNRLYTVRVGPVTDRELASTIARQLSTGGFSSASVTPRTGYRVVSEPLPRSVAEGLVKSLAGRGIHSQVEPLGGDSVQLLFGAFTTQKEAEALSQRIAAQGYDAWVREATVYTLQLGPYPQSSVNTITGIVKSSAPAAPVAADPVP